MEVDELNGNGKFARCIVCNDYSIQKQCYNIFNTSFENGKVLLSEFLKNVLACSVLIVVSPEFFICKRCFSLCSDLDSALARCNDLQVEIRTLFKKTQQKQHTNDVIKEEKFDPDDDLEPQTDVTGELEEEAFYEEEAAQEQEYYEEGQFMNGEEVEEMDPYFFLNTEVVESEVVIGDTPDLEVEEIRENSSKATEQSNELRNAENTTGVTEENNIQDAEQLMCKACNVAFDNPDLLTAHQNSDQCKKDLVTTGIKSVYEFQHFSVKLKKKKKVYFCNRCTYETHVSSSMEKHLKTHRTDPEYMCDVCGRRFKYLKTFTRHQQVHDESRPFGCKLCSFRAMTELQLKIHERQHDDQKKFVCTKCGYKTLKRMSYNIHCRTHTGERPYCCPNCPYKAKDPSTLLRHRRIHGGIKRYQCTHCEYKATQKAALTIHMMTHTGEKPHACGQCDYRSSAKHNLQAHVASIHSNEKPFACTQCSYKTKIKRLLTCHMRRHSNEKPFACPYCDHRMRYRAALSYHLKKKHPIDSNGQVVQTYYVLNFCESKKLRFQGEDLVFSDEAESGSENEAQ